MAWTANPRDPSRQSAKPRCRSPPARMSAHRDGVSDSDMGLPPSLQWDAEHRDHCGLAVSVRATFEDRKSTRLNSSHLVISYAVFCLKKKKEEYTTCPMSTLSD